MTELPPEAVPGDFDSPLGRPRLPSVAVAEATRLEPDGAYRLHPNVAVRPEPFGALVYHYGNRKLVFLKSPRMVAVVKSLDESPSVSAALEANGVATKSVERYLDALNSLLASDMLVPFVEPAAEPADLTDPRIKVVHAR